MPDMATIAKRLATSLAGGAALDRADRPDFALRHEETFAAIFNRGMGTYYTRFDEALKRNYADAIAMRNDASIYELIRHRQYPVLSLPYHLVPDRPEDRSQRQACRALAKVIDATPKLQDLRLSLSEGIFWGKAGAQVAYGRDRVDGERRVVVADHQPIHGDKLVFDFDGVPGVMVHSAAVAGLRDRGAAFFRSDRATCLKLGTPHWRDRFLIHQHEPSDAEYLYEGDKAGAVHGLGLRDRIYWCWWLRQEVLSWCMDAMQRIGANGNFIGYYDAGNAESESAVLKALKDFAATGYVAFPRSMGPAGSNQAFDHIPPTAIAYEVMMALVAYFDGIIRRAIVGQELTGTAQPTGLGSGVADAHESTFAHIVNYDARNLAETLTRDLVGPLARLNLGRLPFKIRLVLEFERDNFAEKLANAQTLAAMGARLDLTDLIEGAGLKPAVEGARAASAVEGKGGAPEPGKPPAEDAERMGSATSPDRYAADRPGEFQEGGGRVPAGAGGHDVADVAPHHRRISRREVPRTVKSHPGRAVALHEGEHGAEAGRHEARVLTEWRVGGEPVAMVAHAPGRAAARAALGLDWHDEDDIADAAAHPYSVLLPSARGDGEGHEADDHFATRAEAEARAREWADDARRIGDTGWEHATVPAGEPWRDHFFSDHDPATHELRLRARHPGPAELRDLAEADRDEFLATHDRADYPSKDAYLAAMRAHVASRLPPGTRARPAAPPPAAAPTPSPVPVASTPALSPSASYALDSLRDLAGRSRGMDPAHVDRMVAGLTRLPAADLAAVHHHLVGAEGPPGKAALSAAIRRHVAGR